MARARASKAVLAFLIGLAFTLLAWGGGLGVDQALFASVANVIRRGGTLYLDLWDNKQPGVYWLYAAAQAAFGDGWPGIRLGYSLWMAAGGAIAATLLLVSRPASRAFLLAPVFTVGIATLRTDAKHMGQVESLVGLPVVALLFLCLVEPRSRAASAARWLAAGALVAAVAVLKLVLVPVPLSVLACALAWRVGRGETTLRGAAAAAVLCTAGLVAVCVPVALHFAARGSMRVFLWTNFVYPRLAVAQAEAAHLPRLLEALGWLLRTCGLLVPAAAVGAWAGRRPLADRASLLALGTSVWLVTAFAVILVQTFSWWAYHMDMLIWPIGILAALGSSAAGGGSTGTGFARVGRAAAALGVGWVALHGAHFAWKARHTTHWLHNPGEIECIETARRVVAAAAKPCGTVYAIGDLAAVQAATGLRQAIPMHGVYLGAFLPAQIEGLPAQLERGRPDLVYVDHFHREFLARRHPAVLAWLDGWLARDYESRGTDALEGTWYERRPRATGACPPPWRFEVPVL